MERISGEKQDQIINLRLIGYSIPEIVKETSIAKTTVWRYVKTVQVPKEYLKRLRDRQGGAIERANGRRENSIEEAIKLLGEVSERDLFILLIGLYWGEGTKRDFSIINSNPQLIQSFLLAIQVIFNIGSDRLSFSLRVHSDVSKRKAIKF